jgi:TrpR-related protein YerC/YecD
MTTNEDWRDERTRSMFEAILSLGTVDEAAAFFRDLCTLAELDAMSQRWQIVLLLEQGLPYREIAERTGSSTATVTRISQWLHHGAGGYRLVVDRLGVGA